MSINIYLSVNNTYQQIRNNAMYSNNDNFLIIPVIPSEFKINKPQNVEEFETVSMKKLAFICPPDLKCISWSSYFPCRDYHFVRGDRINASDYVYTIDKWVENKLPIRLVITGLENEGSENIFMSSCISEFSYSIGQDGDFYYDIEFIEYLLTGVNESEELTLSQYEELSKRIEQVENDISMLTTGYKTLEDIPEWGRSSVEFLISKGYLLGEEDGSLNITDQLLKALKIGYVAGAYHTGMIYNYIDNNMPEDYRPTIQDLYDKGYIQGTEDGLNLTEDMMRILTIVAKTGIFNNSL